MAERFSFVSSKYVEETIKDRMPKNTQRNTAWSINTWNAWVEARNRVRQLGLAKLPTAAQLQFIGPQELNEHLCYFILEVRNKTGDLYSKDTLYNLACGLARFLKEDKHRPDLNFLNSDNIFFYKFRRALTAQMKIATEKGIGDIKKQAQPITDKQEETLWEKGILNMTTAEGLSRAVYFYNCKVFGLRGREEHKNLQVEQFSFGSDESGNYIEFHGRPNKNVSDRLLHKKVNPKQIKQYETEKDISVYSVFKRYIKYIGRSGPFYRKPLPETVHEKIVFDWKPIPVHVLGHYMSKMVKEAGFVGNYSCHSGKVSLATALHKQGVDEQLIVERTGHRSDTVRSCKRPSSEQQKAISEMVDIPQPKTLKFSKTKLQGSRLNYDSGKKRDETDHSLDSSTCISSEDKVSVLD